MALYVMKTFDWNGRLVGRSEFSAGKDDEAIAVMRVLMKDLCCELWCGSRKVADSQGASLTAFAEPRSFQTKHGPTRTKRN